MSKVYKINELKGGALSSLTSLVSSPLLLFALLTAPLAFYLFGLNLGLNIKILIMGLYLILIMVLTVMEVEGQKVYKLINPLISFLTMKKDIIPNIDFDIYQDTLVFKDRLVKIVSIEPIDILLMSNLEKQNFKRDLYSFLNGLSNKHKIQIIYYARQAVNSDYQKHFEALQSIETRFDSQSIKKTRNKRLEAYISELKQIVENNLIPKREFYISLSVNKKDGDKLTDLLTVVDDSTIKTLASLRQAGFSCEVVAQKPLHQFLKTNIRYL